MPSKSACEDFAVASVYAKSTSLKSCINRLRQLANFKYPSSEEEWVEMLDNSRSIDIRRAHLVEDAIKEVQKPRFSNDKLLTVRKFVTIIAFM